MPCSRLPFSLSSGGPWEPRVAWRSRLFCRFCPSDGAWRGGEKSHRHQAETRGGGLGGVIGRKVGRAALACWVAGRCCVLSTPFSGWYLASDAPQLLREGATLRVYWVIVMVPRLSSLRCVPHPCLACLGLWSLTADTRMLGAAGEPGHVSPTPTKAASQPLPPGSQLLQSCPLWSQLLLGAAGPVVTPCSQGLCWGSICLACPVWLVFHL